MGGAVYSLAPNGTTNWMYQTLSYGFLPPVIGPDGTIYVASYADTSIFAFAGSSPVACSGWPQFQRNSRHTGAVAYAGVSNPIMRTNGFQMAITGVTNMPVCDCASSDLEHWTNISHIAIGPGTNEIGTTNYVDTGATNYDYRFYRAFPQ
jgi:subtilisin family serine protease